MTSQVKMAQLGIWPAEGAAAACGDFQSVVLNSGNSQTATVSGSGTNQTSTTAVTSLAGATFQITADLTNFTTVGATFNTAQLTNQGSAFITMFNSGANTVLIYPTIGGTVNGQAVNIPFGIGANKSTTFMSTDGTTWFAAHAG